MTRPNPAKVLTTQQTFEGEDVAKVLAAWDGDGVIVKLRMCSLHSKKYETRLSRSAYEKGFTAGISGESSDASPYYKRALPNFMRGDNDPRDAWKRGWLDGDRVRLIAIDPAKVLDIRVGEVRVLTPSSHSRRVNDQYVDGDWLKGRVETSTVIVGTRGPVECVVTDWAK